MEDNKEKEMTADERAAKIGEAVEKFKLAVLNELFEGLPSKSQLKKITMINDFGDLENPWPERIWMYYRHELCLGYIEVASTHMRWVTEVKYKPIPKQGDVDRTARLLDGRRLDNFPTGS